MKIGVIGNGNMGGALGKLWSSRGHKIMFGSRNPESVKTMAGISPNVNSGSIADAVRFGEVILLAVPWQGVEKCIPTGWTNFRENNNRLHKSFS
jgi:predicted dinucleotide-binding enzyme